MTTRYRVLTPGPIYTFDTFAEADAKVRVGLESIIAPRGRYLEVTEAGEGHTRYTVRNRNDRVVTAVLIRRIDTP